MVNAVPDILARIVETKRADLRAVQNRLPELERLAEARVSQRRDFYKALSIQQPAIIAEVKKASPSRGVLSPDFNPSDIAASYAAGGAACISVLTDETYFQGTLADLETVRESVSLPLLRKDFTIHEAHVTEAAAHGADAILLIAALLTETEMRDLREQAERYRMAALVEVHDAEELRPALASGARIIGVNNRDLHSFAVSLDVSLRLADQIPVLKVSESGISTRADVQRLQAAGYGAFLIGEHLMKTSDPAAALRELAG